jgi:HSP20 family protein
MEEIPGIHLRRLHGQLGQVLYQFTKVQFSHFAPPDSWTPAINAYRCRHEFTICVDLAGVDKTQIDLRVEAKRLYIRGRREAPEPCDGEDKPQQILAMEIDYGPFQRQVPLPAEVDVTHVSAEQRNGFLWVHLPLLGQS